MRTTLVGLEASRKALSAALAQVVPGECAIRAVGRWKWAELPADTREPIVAALAAFIQRELVVIDVEMPQGGRADEVSARRHFAPARGRDEDVSEDAREWLRESTFDDLEEVIAELAWGLADDYAPSFASLPSEAEPEDFEDRWAVGLVAHLVKTRAIELSGVLLPTGVVANCLQWADENDPGLASSIVDALIDSSAVAEVYVDEAEVEMALRETRPTRWRQGAKRAP
ncbi:MAG: hypothetical protein NVSMB53_12010 [Gemmatimonadaceae bacterium]